MTVERTHYGAWRVYDIVAGHLFTRIYIGYTKREAMREFKAEANEETAR